MLDSISSAWPAAQYAVGARRPSGLPPENLAVGALAESRVGLVWNLQENFDGALAALNYNESRSDVEARR